MYITPTVSLNEFTPNTQEGHKDEGDGGNSLKFKTLLYLSNNENCEKQRKVVKVELSGESSHCCACYNSLSLAESVSRISSITLFLTCLSSIRSFFINNEPPHGWRGSGVNGELCWSQASSFKKCTFI